MQRQKFLSQQQPHSKIPVVYGEYTIAGDPISPCKFNFLDNTIFNNTDFTISQALATATIQQGSNWLLCPATSASLSITGAYDLLYGATLQFPSNTTSVNAPGMYIVTVRNGCTLGGDTIAVNGLTATASPSNTSYCAGSTTAATLNVSGNAFSYTWTSWKYNRHNNSCQSNQQQQFIL